MKKLLFLLLMFAMPAAAQVKYEILALAPTDVGSNKLLHGRNGALIKNDFVKFAIETPRGWVLDENSAASDGFGAMYYPWNDKPKARLYVDTFKKVPQIQTAERLKNFEVEKTEKAKTVRIEGVEKISTAGNENVSLIHVRAEGRSILIAYIDEPECVVKLAVAATNDEELKKAEKVFRRWVGSYVFMETEKVQETMPAGE
jgi:hypothetical protein